MTCSAALVFAKLAMAPDIIFFVGFKQWDELCMCTQNEEKLHHN